MTNWTDQDLAAAVVDAWLRSEPAAGGEQAVVADLVVRARTAVRVVLQLSQADRAPAWPAQGTLFDLPSA